jgi:hypothetical protein
MLGHGKFDDARRRAFSTHALVTLALPGRKLLAVD